MNGSTHYYNLVLSKLNLEPDVKLTLIVPTSVGAHIGAGVYQTREGINFKVIELEETRLFGRYTTFNGFAEALLREKPDAVVVIANYMHAFLLDFPVVIAMKKLRAGLILKDHPFRLPSYQDACGAIEIRRAGFVRLPSVINRLLLATGLIWPVRWAQWLYLRALLVIDKRARSHVDAHVNYIKAYELLASWGIPRERIFITRNSPDTDQLFSVKDSLANTPQILPVNPYRLLHVGRLIEWKRVDMLMRAFARVREHFPRAELLIIGTGPEEAALKKLAIDLSFGTSVVFTGGVYDPQLLGQYLMASRLYVLAGMGGLSINDAMCFGLPILCSVGDGTEKVLVREGVNGRYFRDGDEDDLFEKIVWFFDHPEQSQEMGHKSEEIIRNEVNIHTVINGYMEALHYTCKQKSNANHGGRL
jgi:glycosyltransferase involved in cell wall biosynthesis